MSICDVLLGEAVAADDAAEASAAAHRRHLRRQQVVLDAGRLEAAEADHRRRALSLAAPLLAKAKQYKGQHTDAEDEHEEEANGDDDAGRGDGNQLTTLHRGQCSHLSVSWKKEKEKKEKRTGLISGVRMK